MEDWKKAVIGLGLIGVGLVCINRWRTQGECVEGARKTLDCNTCVCASGRWVCTMMACPDELEDRRRF